MCRNRAQRRRLLFNNIDLYKLYIIVPYISRLNRMIGMKSLKNDIVYQILYYLSNTNNYNDLMHTVIYGKPGSGKTEVSKIIADIYVHLGFLSKKHITFAKRSDMIAEYLGQTAVKTQNLLESCRGGCLIIDEAYSLGNAERSDSYSKECIDVINQFLTENKKDFMCIIIGYEEELQKCFFNQNPGLERRFPWKYKIEQYTPIELLQIFKNQVLEHNWKIEENAISIDIFKENIDLFSNYGGDTDIFFTKCKMSHIGRVFGEVNSIRNTLTKEDIKCGLDLFIKHKKKNNNPIKYPQMYI